ncbi:histidine kinase [Actinomycetospora sp. OC33-EN08]|uniref:Histidine kinase n=1 Tax=Actinomycetospora aurantiaca TaxID=3129233 RepID=A0ABU8MTE4_9PSEU
MTTADDATDATDATAGRERRRDHWQRRRRLERRLHDGAALRISSLALRLGVLDAPREQIDALQGEVADALDELRAVAAGIYPPLLHEAGLGPALLERVRATGADVALDVADDRCGPAAEGAAYFALVEVLTGSPGPLAVGAHRDGTELVVRIGGADPALAAVVRDEAAPLGGTVEAGPDTIVARFPCG